jgi:hypothetical protein
MCNFFSFLTNGDGKFLFFNWELRQKIDRDLDPDSHTAIADYFGYTGLAEDHLNKYEFNPNTGRFVVDQINNFDDSAAAEEWVRNLNFSLIDPIKTNHSLPTGLTSVGGYLDLRGYQHPLPTGLTSVGGGLDLRGYQHPLPTGLTSVGGYLYLRGYQHPLPTGLTSVGGELDLGDYQHPLPTGLVKS